MSAYDDKIRKLELEFLMLQAENRKLESQLSAGTVAPFKPSSDELDPEVKNALRQLAATERLAEWS